MTNLIPIPLTTKRLQQFIQENNNSSLRGDELLDGENGSDGTSIGFSNDLDDDDDDNHLQSSNGVNRFLFYVLKSQRLIERKQRISRSKHGDSQEWPDTVLRGKMPRWDTRLNNYSQNQSFFSADGHPTPLVSHIGQKKGARSNP
jgi:hypothetical protein